MAEFNADQFKGQKPERQGRLFNPLGVPRRQPHEQTFDEFARSPRTWWHGSGSSNIEDIRGGYSDQGFHVGSLKSAYDRRTHKALGGRPAGYLHPVRIDENTRKNMDYSLDAPGPDKGESWDEEFDAPSYYRNDYEDAGSTSAILSSATHVDTYVDVLARANRKKQRLGGYQQETLDAYHRTGEPPSIKINDTSLVKTDVVTGHAPRRIVTGVSNGPGDKTADDPMPVHRYDYDNTTRPREIAAMRSAQFDKVERPQLFRPVSGWVENPAMSGGGSTEHVAEEVNENAVPHDRWQAALESNGQVRAKLIKKEQARMQKRMGSA